MKKIILLLFLLNFCFSSVFAKPFLSTDPSNRVEQFKVIINDNEVKTFDPQEDDSLIVDVIKDLGLKSKNIKVKLTFIASNSDGDSNLTSFYLRIYKRGIRTIYEIEPILENPLEILKFDQDNLKVILPKGRW